MKPLSYVLCVLLVGLLVAGCGEGAATATPMPTRTPVPTGTQAAAPAISTCPPANGTGETPPDLAVLSITFVVNGRTQVVRAGDTLPASSGDAVQVREVTVCADPFSGNGGEACVELIPHDANGQALVMNGFGTHTRPVISGVMSIPGPRTTWTIGDTWQRISVVVNHWPLGGSSDPSCGEGRCEHDDQVLVPLVP